MKNKKGFTLIELLAVIVILAIIALIATPVILNVIDRARKGSAVDSTYGYIEAIEYQNQMNALDNEKYTGISDGSYDDVENINVNVKGKKPDEGNLTIEKGKVITARLCINGYWINYENDKAEADTRCTPGVKLIKEINPAETSSTLDSLTIPIEAVEGTTVTATAVDSEGNEITGTIENGVVTFSGLKAGKNYKYEIKAIDSSGNETVRKGTLTTVSFNNIDISEDDTNWTQKKTITITTEENLNGTRTELQYKIGSGNWTKYTEAFDINENTTVYARLKNGENTSDEETLTITTIDTSKPTSATFTHEDTNTSITVKAVGEDNESRIGYYQFSSDNGANWTPVQASDTYTFTGLSTGDKLNIKVRVINNTYRNELNSNNYLESAKEEVTVPKQKHTVTFKNGNDTVEERQVEEGTALGTLPTEGINVPEGKKVVWYTQANGSGTKVTPSTTMGTSNVTYYAYLKEVNIICKRVTDSSKLHTETCVQGSDISCTNKYSNGATITYGNAKANNSALAAGDAFDCKVSKTGDYTERFYYVSDYYDGETNTFNSNVAVLIYSNNTVSGTANSSSSNLKSYYSSGDNWHGPVTAKTNLPTTTQWDNITLYKVNRYIRNNNSGTTTNVGGNTISNPFSYSGYAARLLTHQETLRGCNNQLNSSGYVDRLQNCDYLLENTKYSSNSKGTYGYWCETPEAGNNVYAIFIAEQVLAEQGYSTSYASDYGVRPVIEVNIDDLEY